MTKELKIYIDDADAIQKSLIDAGGQLEETLNEITTYYNTPEGEVMKTSEDENGFFFQHLRKEGDFFVFVENTKWEDDKEENVAELESKYGVKRVMKRKRIVYDLEGRKLDFHLIEEVGDFLIQHAEEPTLEFFKKIGLQSPKILNVPFTEV